MTSNRQNFFNLSTSQNEQTLRKEADETGAELVFEFDYFAKINGALYYNDAPLFNSLDVINNSTREIACLRLDFHSTPEFFKPFSVYLDRLAPGERRRVVRFDMSLDYDFLARISEQTRAEILIDAFENERKKPEKEERTSAIKAPDGWEVIRVEQDNAEESVEPLYSQSFPVDVCANDDWFGIGILPSFLAAFVTPNVDSVARLMGDAA